MPPRLNDGEATTPLPRGGSKQSAHKAARDYTPVAVPSASHAAQPRSHMKEPGVPNNAQDSGPRDPAICLCVLSTAVPLIFMYFQT